MIFEMKKKSCCLVNLHHVLSSNSSFLAFLSHIADRCAPRMEAFNKMVLRLFALH